MDTVKTENFSLYNGDCLQVMQQLIDEGVQVDSVCTDAPYGIGFFNKTWDSPDNIAFRPKVWELCLQLLKPGGHLVAFSAARTYHRMAMAIEDAGFEIREGLFWCYGTGFAKGLNVSKAIDKEKGLERPVIGKGFAGLTKGSDTQVKLTGTTEFDLTGPASPEAAEWEGWNTNLKPCVEPIVLARKPLAEPTVAKNVIKYGTGAINIDACRIPRGDELQSRFNEAAPEHINENTDFRDSLRQSFFYDGSKGGYPGNLLLEDCKEIEECFDPFKTESGKSPTRFFYSAKASTQEKNEGLVGYELINENISKEEYEDILKIINE